MLLMPIGICVALEFMKLIYEHGISCWEWVINGIQGFMQILYADDTQIYMSFNPKYPGDEQAAITTIEACIVEIKAWMKVNKLKLNYDKTELVFFSSRQIRKHISSDSLHIGDTSISHKDTVRNLGVMFDNTMSMENQVKKICQSGYFHIRNINSIRKHLSQQHT